MNFPDAGRYSEAVQNPQLFFLDPEIKRRRAQTDRYGLPMPLSGGFAYTYRFQGGGGDIAVRCFHRQIPDLFQRYAAISQFLSALRSRFFVNFAFAERGVRIEGRELPVVRMEWVDGETLLDYVSRLRHQPEALHKLREQLVAFAEEAESRGYAHGDVQHRNIIVMSGGALRFVDYDGMFVPVLKALQAADNGHPHFQPPLRTAKDFGVYMDRFSLAVMDLSLEALARSPKLFDDFHLGENIILSRNDFTDPAGSDALNAIASIPGMESRVAAFADYCRLSPQEIPPLREFRQITTHAPVTTGRAPVPPPAAQQDYVGPYDVVDGMNFSQASKFIGKPVEIIGQVLQVRTEAKLELMLLRFGERYSNTPTVVVPFSILPNISNKSFWKSWISARGVLRTHRVGVYSTVQIMLSSASDIEILSSKEEADFRLGRVKRARQPPPPAPRSPAKPSPPPKKRDWTIIKGRVPPARPSQEQTASTPPPPRPSPPPPQPGGPPIRPAPTPTFPTPTPNSPFPAPSPSGSKDKAIVVGVIVLIFVLILIENSSRPVQSPPPAPRVEQPTFPRSVPPPSPVRPPVPSNPVQAPPQLPLVEQPPPAPVLRPVQRERVITQQDSNVRHGPSNNAAVARIAPRGTELNVHGRSGNWVQVGDETAWGWIHSSLLEPLQ